MATRQDVFNAVSEERLYQDRKWGTVDQRRHGVGAWLTIMRALIADAEQAYISQAGDVGALDEIRKVVAVGVACMEQHAPVIRRSPSDLAEQHRRFMTRKRKEQS